MSNLMILGVTVVIWIFSQSITVFGVMSLTMLKSDKLSPKKIIAALFLVPFIPVLLFLLLIRNLL